MAYTVRGRISDKDGGFSDYTAQVKVLTPAETLQAVRDELQDIIDEIPANLPLVDKLEDALAKIDTAIAELNAPESDMQTAAGLGGIEGAIGGFTREMF